MNSINCFIVVEVSIVLRTYSGTEGLQAVEICLQIVQGTINRSAGAAAVDVWTVSQTVVGKLHGS
jgi:hypothetical protein